MPFFVARGGCAELFRERKISREYIFAGIVQISAGHSGGSEAQILHHALVAPAMFSFF